MHILFYVSSWLLVHQLEWAKLSTSSPLFLLPFVGWLLFQPERLLIVLLRRLFTVFLSLLGRLLELWTGLIIWLGWGATTQRRWGRTAATARTWIIIAAVAAAAAAAAAVAAFLLRLAPRWLMIVLPFFLQWELLICFRLIYEKNGCSYDMR